jgi:MYXO-CTERM domain-containing protein
MVFRFRHPLLVVVAPFVLLSHVSHAADTARSAVPARVSDGLSMLRWMQNADDALAPQSQLPTAYFRIPEGNTAAALGAEEIAPGIARIRKSSADLLRFGAQHQDLSFELNPPLHLLNDRIGKFIRKQGAYAQGVTGEGAFVGIADTGLDVTHPDFRDDQGKSRVAWLLDLSRRPRGTHADVEDRFKIRNGAGAEIGAVYTGADIDALIANGTPNEVPTDVNGHGSHVTSIAAGGRGGPKSTTDFSGVAPGAKLIVVRLTRSANPGIETDDLVTAARFIFDRADAEGKPAVVNMSLGTDFGPHDGSLLWEQAIASNIGPSKPGHVIVAAAGNSGSIQDPIHQSVFVTEGSVMRVPIESPGGARAGRVQVWLTKRPGAEIDVGLEGADGGTWIDPVAPGNEQGKSGTGFTASVFNGSTAASPVPKGSNGAVALWSGTWPKGAYNVVLKGKGNVELYLQTYGDADLVGPTRFRFGVRAGTINLPASHPNILSVGCTVSRPKWKSISKDVLGPVAPNVDLAGALPALGRREIEEGEMCFFSSAGPNANGVPKPEIAAPGAGVIAAMSGQAGPDAPASIFATEQCPENPKTGKVDSRCLQIDANHAVSSGTSMSSPVVAGVAALLLSKNPKLTQGEMTALLQAGARPFRGPAPYMSQSGPGEVDAVGALDALQRFADPKTALPSAAASWIALSTDYVAADRNTPTVATLELRTADGSERADVFDPARLKATVLVDGAPVEPLPTITRVAPGLFRFNYTPAAGLGGRNALIGASFDGTPIVAPRSLPIAADGWRALYAPRGLGGCSTGASSSSPSAPMMGLGLGLVLAYALRRRRHRS